MQHPDPAQFANASPVEVLPPVNTQPLVLQLDEGLSPETSMSLRAAFEELFTQADKWRASALSIQITSVDQVREMKLARETRLALREIRIKADKKRKELKEDSLKKGKAIDGLYNVLAFAVEPLEKHLMEQEKFAERMEEERKAKLKVDRENALMPYEVDTSVYQLAEMSNDAFDGLLETVRLAWLARKEAARKAEEERIERERIEAQERAEREAAALAERERLRLENERLEREKAAQEAEHRAERERMESERQAELARINREREAAEEKARQEREAAAAQAQIERVAREKLEAELRAREAEEKQAAEQLAAAERAAATAPDREKLLALAKAIRELPIPELQSQAGSGIINLIREQAEKFAKWIETQATKLN